ncbi:MAG TPA: class A beta-lactamase [Vicinamibacterales bacterium]
MAFAAVGRLTITAADDVQQELSDIERRVGGRLGVAIVDTRNGQQILHRANERFPMCSTFKLLAAGAVLARVDRGEERLDRRIAYTSADLLEYAPVTRARVADGSMSVVDLAAAAVTVSDNTAGNLLLSTISGPAGLTAWIRSLGDTVTRLDRNEPTLNEGAPGDPRDTTSPSAIVGSMRKLLVENVLTASSKQRLIEWMVASTTGTALLRSSIPTAWRAGDKSGRGGHGSTNDLGVFWPPDEHPILVASFVTDSSRDLAERERALAGIGRIAAAIRARA